MKKRKKVAKATLSFALDDEGDGEETPEGGDGETSTDGPPTKRGKFRKNPNVDTSFLPDRDREEAERKERERLRQEWLKNQEEIKQEEIEVMYSFWDGSGHRKSVTVSRSVLSTYDRPSLEDCTQMWFTQCKKGDDISTFLEKCRQQFPELRSVSVDNLMYVKVSEGQN